MFHGLYLDQSVGSPFSVSETMPGMPAGTTLADHDLVDWQLRVRRKNGAAGTTGPIPGRFRHNWRLQ